MFTKIISLRLSSGKRNYLRTIMPIVAVTARLGLNPERTTKCVEANKDILHDPNLSNDEKLYFLKMLNKAHKKYKNDSGIKRAITRVNTMSLRTKTMPVIDESPKIEAVSTKHLDAEIKPSKAINDIKRPVKLGVVEPQEAKKPIVIRRRKGIDVKLNGTIKPSGNIISEKEAVVESDVMSNERDDVAVANKVFEENLKAQIEAFKNRRNR